MIAKAFLASKNVARHQLRLFDCNSGRLGVEDLEDGEFLFWFGSKLSTKMKNKYDEGKYQEIFDFVATKCEISYFESEVEGGFAGYYAYEASARGGIVTWNGE